MRDDEPPLLPASPAPGASPARRPSRFKRALNSLRSSFRSSSPFHFASLRRSSAKSSVSDSEIARGERTMRKKSKKHRADSAASAAAAASRSTDSSPAPDGKKTALLKRMSTIGKRRAECSTPSSTDLDMDPELETDPEPAHDDDAPILETSVELEKQEPPPEDVPASPSSLAPDVTSASPELPFTLAVEHPVAMRCFTKEAWKRRSITEIPKPIEESGPEEQLKRHIVFSAPTAFSDDRDDDDDDDDDDDEDAGVGGGEVGSLEEAVKLARQRLAQATQSSAPPHSVENNTEEEGCADTMPAYGDLIEPEHKAEADDEPVSERRVAAASGAGAHCALSGRRLSVRCARAMTFEESAADECYLTVCECCGFSAETSLLYPAHATASAERREHLYKILVIGELGTGKTSIIKRYVHQFFSQHYRATIGVDFALKVLNWDANTIIRLQLWDIAGQERFGNMTRVYYKEAVGAFIVFDVSRVATFDAVVKWKNDLDTKVQLPDGSPIPCILLANKCDQQKEGIVNSPTKMDEYCREKGFAGWFETSAKENINIEEAARSLVNKILLNDKLLQSNDKDGDKFGLDHKIANGENTREKSSGKSCAC